MQAKRNRATQPIAVAALFLMLAWTAGSLAQTSVDLNTWSQKGPASAGNWAVENGGDSVYQSINGEPTYFVSPNDFFNTTIDGSFLQDQVRNPGFNDDDFLGFVFGYNEPGDNATDASFFLLDWKQGSQSSTEEGFRLSRVNGTGTPPFGSAESDSLPDYDVLATNTGGTLGWVDNVPYNFSLLYQEDRIKVDITGGTGDFQAGLTVFDLTAAEAGLAAFPTGRFGFYNHSQAGVEYRSFTLTEAVLATTPDDGGTLDFLTRIDTPVEATLNVANAGGPGTSLNGTAGSPSGPLFAGPSEAAAFSLASGDDADFTLAYSPTARTAGVADVDSLDVTSTEDGVHTIGLSGTAVGPVADFGLGGSPLSPGATLDFGTIAPTVQGSLMLDVLNVTPDPDESNADLTNLTINAVQFSGDDAGVFSVLGFTPGATIAKDGSVLLEVGFDPAGASGLFDDATITLFTDQGTSLGGDGEQFSFSLVGMAIPEPASLLLLATVFAGMASQRR